MRLFLPLFLMTVFQARADSEAGRIWAELAAKRSALSSFHQEFDLSQISQTARGKRAAKQHVTLDMSHDQWRERLVSGAGTHIRVFDGTDTFRMEEGGTEFVRTKSHSKEEDLSPAPYKMTYADWPSAKEKERRPCGLANLNHSCVVLEVPLKSYNHVDSATDIIKMSRGSVVMLLDLETGLMLSSHTFQVFENRSSGYQTDTFYAWKRMTFGAPADAELFKPPMEGAREVKELSAWNAAKIRKQLGGKPAPELEVTDVKGNKLSLADFRGKTVLLDFWTTWCPPCRADAPALDKLYEKYGAKDLMIIGISVSEERAVVEKFLQEHPHHFPVVLTPENEVPRPYQIGVFPTYIVIGPDGTMASATEGDQGFAELRRMLKKAGLETN